MHSGRMYSRTPCCRSQRTDPSPNHHSSALVSGSLSVYRELRGCAPHGSPRNVPDDVGNPHLFAAFRLSTRSHWRVERPSSLRSDLVSGWACRGPRHTRSTRDTAAPRGCPACVLAAMVAAVKLGKIDGSYSLGGRWIFGAIGPLGCAKCPGAWTSTVPLPTLCGDLR